MKGLKNAGRLLLLGWGFLTAMAMGRTAEAAVTAQAAVSDASVDPVRAVTAAVIAFLVGVVLYIVRHRCFNLDVSNE